MIDLLTVKVQGLFSAPFPLTSVTLMATFIPETPPASPNFLPSASGPLSPPAQSWDLPNVQPFSLASYKFLIKELTHSRFHDTHPSALHLHPSPSPDHTELRTTSTRHSVLPPKPAASTTFATSTSWSPTARNSHFLCIYLTPMMQLQRHMRSILLTFSHLSIMKTVLYTRKANHCRF